MHIKVRKAEPKDLDSINNLSDAMHRYLASLYHLRLSEESLEDEHACKGELESIYVAEDDEGDIVGCLHFASGENEWVGPHYRMDHLVIREDCMGKGVARELCNQLVERARKEGMNVTTGTLERNKQALGFYQDLGFKPFNVQMVLDMQKRLFKD